MSGKPSIAVAGATGHLGQHITTALLSPEFRPQFDQVILISRQSASSHPQLSKWQEQGAVISSYDENNLSACLGDATVYVNAVGSKGDSGEMKKKMMEALANSKVKLDILSEFGVDHTVHDFPNAEWDKKKAIYERERKVLPNIKLCRVYVGLFLEDSIGPWFGFDTNAGKYESVGSAKSPITFTSLGDIGRAVASLVSMPLDKIPNEVRLAGDTVSISEIAVIMQKAGAGSIDVTEIDLQKYKRETIEEGTPNPAKYLRFVMGENKLNHSSSGLGNDNELVNPGEKKWKWKKMTDLAEETNGRPWADYQSKKYPS